MRIGSGLDWTTTSATAAPRAPVHAVLLDGHDEARLPRRRLDRLRVERLERPAVKHPRADAALQENVGRGQRGLDHLPHGDDRAIVALAKDIGLAWDKLGLRA